MEEYIYTIIVTENKRRYDSGDWEMEDYLFYDREKAIECAMALMESRPGQDYAQVRMMEKDGFGAFKLAGIFEINYTAGEV